MIYTIGGSFWEFGGPDLERAKLFVMIGTAEDHHSNPLKIAISKFKRGGGRFISINPVRTGYSAIADEWVPIKPRAPTARCCSRLIHEIIALGLYDREFPRALHQRRPSGQPRPRERPTSACWSQASPDPEGNPLRPAEQAVVGPHQRTGRSSTSTDGADPFCSASSSCPTARRSSPRSSCCMERVKDYTPEWAADITGIPAATIRRLAHEMGITARDQKIELPIAWTDSWGKRARNASPATRSRSMPCAGSRRTPTAFRPSARSRS